MKTDHELMRKLQQGDECALTLLVERHQAKAVSYAFSILGDDRLAQDAAQDSFVKVYLLRQEYLETFSFQAYLYALIRNRCIDELRRQKRHPCVPLFEGEAAAYAAESPEEAYLRKERRLLLLNAIEALPDAERELLMRFAYCGQNYRQLASELHLSMAQVKIGLYRIRQKLKRKIGASPKDF
ncbi:MAG: RNA polymerase sigma factor [Clostridia bacterium]